MIRNVHRQIRGPSYGTCTVTPNSILQDEKKFKFFSIIPIREIPPEACHASVFMMFMMNNRKTWQRVIWWGKQWERRICKDKPLPQAKTVIF
jgi:hypothetical protein